MPEQTVAVHEIRVREYQVECMCQREATKVTLDIEHPTRKNGLKANAPISDIYLRHSQELEAYRYRLGTGKKVMAQTV